MNKKLHYILIGSITIVELILILLFFLNIFSTTSSRLSCYVDTNVCKTVLVTNYFSAFSYNVDKFVYLVIITLVTFGISTTTIISSVFFKNRNYNIVSYVFSFVTICLFVSMFIITKVGPQKIG